MKTSNDEIISYYNNCEKVKVGMTLKEAREIIGDLKYQYWSADEISAEIIVYERNNELTYSLNYPMYFGGSDNIQIKFNPNTLIVTNVFCGE